MKFVDEAVISVKAGDGGNGCMSFRREKFVPRGGPNGGSGGSGGDVVLVADTSVGTLLDFKYQPLYKAKQGVHGQSSDKHGANAKDLVIKVPCGTEVFDEDTKMILADLINNGDYVVAAEGGLGGRGNTSFKSSTNRAPRIVEKGNPGEERNIRLELKLIADVGLVGLPNAGKSTLISRMSAAKPKIADYPFTTLVPNLGVVKGAGGKSFVVADLPGLIEGASQGHGLGHQFLKHIERTRLILHLVDCQNDDPVSDIKTINNELETFEKSIIEKPLIVLLAKTDTISDENEIKKIENKIKEEFEGTRVIAVSAVTGVNVDIVVKAVSSLLIKMDEKDEEDEAPKQESWEP